MEISCMRGPPSIFLGRNRFRNGPAGPSEEPLFTIAIARVQAVVLAQGKTKKGPFTRFTFGRGNDATTQSSLTPACLTASSLPMSEPEILNPSGRAVVWVTGYLIGWVMMGISCKVGLPGDCHRASQPLEVLTELPVLLAFALAQVRQ